MMAGWRRALRFARNWGRDGRGVQEVELEVPRSDRSVEATLFRPEPFRGPVPGWVVLHGITRPGRRHPTLLRFVRALARSGAAVLVPEVPEWRELYLAMEQAWDTVRGAVPTLANREEVSSGRIGVMGFSMGVPPVLFSGTDRSLEGHLRAVAGFGGFCSLDSTLRFLFTGRHDWEGRVLVGDPDPYGRWVVGGNYLTKVPGFEDAVDVEQALLRLAREAGDLQVGSWEPSFDPRKEEILEGIDPTRREIFRAFAPPAGEVPPEDLSSVLAPALAKAARDASPFSQPSLFADRVFVPTRLIHGRGDRLIPFSESVRLAESFPPGGDVRVYLTGLFAHSKAEGGTRVRGRIREPLQFLRIIADLLGLV